ncbi:MAG: 2-amino-4-hydroxy-6-hydroxymethyldihydropteridine diphosphokinase, partial [bacterium]
MQTAYIGIGSNLGNKENNLRQAALRLSKLDGTELRRASSLYYTEPVGGIPQAWYFNVVQEVGTSLGPEELLDGLLKIEAEMGRKRSGLCDAPRIIDLDILIFGDCVIDTDSLTVPHPHLPVRRFVLEPLAEIAKELVCPG